MLALPAIEGAIIAIDATGCQRDIAQTVAAEKKAEYGLALKRNQGLLRADVGLFVAEQRDAGFKKTTVSQEQTVEGDHGRIEARTTAVIHRVDWLQEGQDWPGLNAILVVEGGWETAARNEWGRPDLTSPP